MMICNIHTYLYNNISTDAPDSGKSAFRSHEIEKEKYTMESFEIYLAPGIPNSFMIPLNGSKALVSCLMMIERPFP